MATIAIKYRSNTDDRGSLYIRFTEKRVRRFVALDVQIREKDWNEQKEEVRRGSDDAANHNRKIAAARAIANEVVALFEFEGDDYTADDLKTKFEERFLGKVAAEKRHTGKTFTEYAKERVELYNANGQFSTYDAHSATYAKLLGYQTKRSGSERIEFADLTPSFIEGFRVYLFSAHGNKPTTTHKNIRHVRKWINDAIRDKYVARDDYPFGRGRFQLGDEPSPEEAPVFLTADEFERFKALRPKPGTDAADIHRMFLFGVYEQGMRISDLIRLKFKRIIRGDGEPRLGYRAKKTGKLKTLRIIQPAAEILAHYEATRDTSPNNYIFPLLDNFEPETLSDEDYYRLIKKRTAYVNKVLKKLAAKAHVHKELTSHSNRHTFANLALDWGWTIVELNKAFDHSKLSTTQKYVRKLRDEDLDAKHVAMFV